LWSLGLTRWWHCLFVVFLDWLILLSVMSSWLTDIVALWESLSLCSRIHLPISAWITFTFWTLGTILPMIAGMQISLWDFAFNFFG
jgi:hypothetical protein